MIKVLFVCTGNICRSPTAEAVFRHQVERLGLAGVIATDSAGTHDYHVGEPPDFRAQLTARRRGYEMSHLRGRQICLEDFAMFDHILAMDRGNLALLERLCPPEHAGKLRLFMEYSGRRPVREVPDPYYGGPEGFDAVLDMVEDGALGLLQHISPQLKQEDS